MRDLGVISKEQQHLSFLSADLLVGTVLGALLKLTPSVLITTLRGKHYYLPQFTGEETVTERLSNLLKITQLGIVEPGLDPGRAAPVNHYAVEIRPQGNGRVSVQEKRKGPRTEPRATAKRKE